jgi:SecD/SecF fusion protein
MGKLFKTACLVIAVIIGCFLAVTPPEKKLRKGKDLAGGVSMVYAVQIDPGEDAKVVLEKTIEVLKRRVDPNGLMDIAMNAVGRDRIEITMSLPGDAVKKKRAEYEAMLQELGSSQLSESRLQSVFALPAAEREAQLSRLSAGNDARLAALRKAAQATDAASALTMAYEAETDPSAKESLAAQAAAAQLEAESARAQVLRTALSASDIRKVTLASSSPRSIDDDGKRVMLPSARQIAETQLLARYPESSEQIKRILAAHNEYIKVRTTLDDPNDLVRMLKGAGVLSFRIAPRIGIHPEETRLRQELRAGGPRNVKSADARWFKLNKIESWLNTKAQAEAYEKDPDAIIEIMRQMRYVVDTFGGEAYMLCWDTRQTRMTLEDGNWGVASAGETVDERGRPAISFAMNPVGASLLSQLTGDHVGQPMAVLLDDEVYTAPNLIERLPGSGQITGDFSKEEREYVIRVLGGGSLQAKLSPEPISISSIGPELGADNLSKGMKTGLISLVIVAGFMVVYYFGYGVVAVVALLANTLFILGAMALSKAAFTMPGIAGLILTFGMAVDSNVLIYERIREEFRRGADMKSAVRLGFDKALAAIVDGNVTNLIVCVVLYYTGTPEIRGFAITMGVGVLSTLFASLVVSKLIFNTFIALGWRRGSPGASMLPMAVPGLQEFLTPRIDWLKYRYVFFTVSAAVVALGLGMVFFQGREMLDNEFRGGTQVTLKLREGQTMRRPDVEEIVKGVAATLPEGDDLRNLASAEVIAVDPQADNITSGTFTIKTVATNASAVLDALKVKFQDRLDNKPALAFDGSDVLAAARAPIYPIDKPTLGEVIGKPGATANVSAYSGGAAIVIGNINPPASLESIRQRLESARLGENYSDTLSRKREVVLLSGTEASASSVALLVADERFSLLDNEKAWEDEVRTREWNLVSDALAKDASPASVHTFSPAIANTFRANALTATVLSFLFIGIYIWIRFKAPRYSIAAIVALLHDVLCVVGLVALAEILYNNKSTHGLANTMMLLPFKIDLNMVAALLTIAGYSLNDTVVIMDRIRENKGKLPHATRQIINDSINQTFSRTLITGGTTMASCIALYILGGEGMRAFAFALFTGLVVGTYSSVAVAAPIVWSRRNEAGTTEHVPSGRLSAA